MHSHEHIAAGQGYGLIVAVSYHDEWQDGLGARGWKMDRAIGDPVLIASTSYAGEKIPTSVLIHDMLDHHLCGFGLSGHRNEAKATLQLGLRSGTEIASSYAQLAEDIINTGINGEPLLQFLPDALRARLPADATTDRQRIRALVNDLGHAAVRQALLEQLWICGNHGRAEALENWQAHGLDYARRSAIGMALQRLLERAETHINANTITSAQGQFRIGNTHCAIHLDATADFHAVIAVDVAVHPAPAVTALTLQGPST